MILELEIRQRRVSALLESVRNIRPAPQLFQLRTSLNNVSLFNLEYYCLIDNYRLIQLEVRSNRCIRSYCYISTLIWNLEKYPGFLNNLVQVN